MPRRGFTPVEKRCGLRRNVDVGTTRPHGRKPGRHADKFELPSRRTFFDRNPVHVNFNVYVLVSETENLEECIMRDVHVHFLHGNPIGYYNIMFQLCESGLFNGLAHPDSIKCFGYKPSIDLTGYYNKLALLLNQYGMYAENNGGLHLNYNPNIELGLNSQLLSILRNNNVQIETASDAHKQSDVGANIVELENMLKNE